MSKIFNFSLKDTFKILQEVSNYFLPLAQIKPDKKYTIEIKEYREKRSLDANAYCWVLIANIADAVVKSKEDVYFDMLKAYGQCGVIKVPNAMTENFKRAYKYHEEHEKLTDEKAVYFRFYVGSSNYDTKEMSGLIEGIIHEAQQLDIETKTPYEIERIMNTWEQY